MRKACPTQARAPQLRGRAAELTKYTRQSDRLICQSIKYTVNRRPLVTAGSYRVIIIAQKTKKKSHTLRTKRIPNFCCISLALLAIDRGSAGCQQR